jgi:hypothetical protein
MPLIKPRVLERPLVQHRTPLDRQNTEARYVDATS